MMYAVKPKRTGPLDPIETAAYWYFRQYGIVSRSEPRSAREMNAKRSSWAMAIGRLGPIWAERQITAREAYRQALAIYREDKEHARQVAKDLAFKTQCARMVGREHADELPATLLVGRQCIPCDRGESFGRTWTYSHLEHLTCKIMAVTGDKPEERQYTVEVLEHPTIRACGMSWRKNSLRGLVCKLPAVSLIEHVTDRRKNTTARMAVDTAKRYHIAWSLIGGAVVIPGTQKTYAYRMRLRGVGCRWDKARKAWTA